VDDGGLLDQVGAGRDRVVARRLADLAPGVMYEVYITPLMARGRPQAASIE